MFLIVFNTGFLFVSVVPVTKERTDMMTFDVTDFNSSSPRNVKIKLTWMSEKNSIINWYNMRTQTKKHSDSCCSFLFSLFSCLSRINAPNVPIHKNLSPLWRGLGLLQQWAGVTQASELRSESYLRVLLTGAPWLQSCLLCGRQFFIPMQLFSLLTETQSEAPNCPQTKHREGECLNFNSRSCS